MLLVERVKRYAAIEKYRERPVIVYATSTRPGIPAMMGSDAIREFIDQIDRIKNGDAIDILIHSNGGDPLASWKIMSILRERFTKIGVLVPNQAFSAATLFALGADEIVMHPHASLGPIDPQITIRTPDGSVKQGFAYEDIGGFLRFIAEDVKIESETHRATLAEKLVGNVEPTTIGYAKRASALSADVGARLLSTHMTDADKARQIALNLNKAFFAHGDAVSRTRARTLELKIAESNTELEKLIWAAYEGIEEYMLLRRPFNPIVEFCSDQNAAASLAPQAPVVLPPNTPPQFAEQVWNAVLSQAAQRAAAAGVEVERAIISAVIESERYASQHRARRRINVFRLPNGEIKYSALDVESTWEAVSVTGSEASGSGTSETSASAPPPTAG